MKGIRIRATNDVLNLIDETAKLLGKNRTDFILRACTEKAQDVLLDQVYFHLETNAFMDFSALIKAPFEPSENFKKFITAQPIWEK